MPIIRVNKIDFYYEDCGKGYPLILISGLGSNSMSWKTVLNILSKHYRVITFDNRGAGRSGAPDGAYSISQMTEDLNGLLEYLNIDKAHVLGHSMGGFIAQELALKYPEKINKLMLCCTMDKLSKRNKVLFESMYSSWKNGLSKYIWFRKLYCWVFSPKFFEDEQIIEFAVQFALEYPYQQTLAGFYGQLKACEGFSTFEGLKNVYHDTLVLSGEDDNLITPLECEIMRDKITNSKSVVISGVGHTPHVENKEEFSKNILEFLQ